MQRNRQRKRNRNASDCEVDRELEAQPEPSQAQQAQQASGAARWDRHKNNSWHSKKCKLHFLMNLPAAVEAGPVLAPNVVEARLVPLIKAQVEACTMRALLGSVLFGLMVRRCFPAHIPAEVAIIPNLADRNLFLHLCRGLPPPGERARPSEAVEEVLAEYPALHARLRDVPRFSHDINTVDAVGNKLETSFANSLTELFTRRVEQAVALAGATLFAGSFELRRRLGVPLGGRPAWTQRERSWVSRSVQGKVVTWLQGAGGVVPTGAMREAVAKQRGLLGLREGQVANRWRAFLPNIDYLRPNAGQKFENLVHTDGVAVSLMFTRPRAELPDKLPCMGKDEGAVNPLAHLGTVTLVALPTHLICPPCLPALPVCLQEGRTAALLTFQSGSHEVHDVQWCPTNSTVFGSVTSGGRLEVGARSHHCTPHHVLRWPTAHVLCTPCAALACSPSYFPTYPTLHHTSLAAFTAPRAVPVCPSLPLPRPPGAAMALQIWDFDLSTVKPVATQKTGQKLSCLLFATNSPVVVCGSETGQVSLFRLYNVDREYDTAEEQLSRLEEVIRANVMKAQPGARV
ncbi:hypothetical protein QJQ45_003985 [Haematococcus lacustris]|nr:hypothetical protein QJQ45_003985 [Haematococcus lacustris]